MPLTVRERLEGQVSGFVGRETERHFLHRLLADDDVVVVFVHGIGGVGKSSLLEAFSREVRALGAIVLCLDGRTIEPTVRGFLGALSEATGYELTGIEDVAARVSGLSARVIIEIDAYDGLRPLEGWLQRSLLPALGDHVGTVIAGRDVPSSSWRLAFGALFAGFAVENLPRPDAEALLRLEGVAEPEIDRINRLAYGHPLSLRLAAAALAARPTLDPDATTISAIAGELTELYLGGLDPQTRTALDAASVVRRPTLTLLAAMLPEAAPQDAFERLRGLPFVDLGTDGLMIHDTVREVVATYLRSTDPDRSRRYRIAAWRQLRDEVARAGPSEVGRYTADLLFMLENPVIRESYFPRSGRPYVIDAARPDDWPAMVRMTQAQYPGAPTADLETWWKHVPSAFQVARDVDGRAVGMCTISDPALLPRQVLGVDPVARRWRDHLRHQPVPRGQRAVAYRMERAFPDDPAQELVHAALVLHLARTWMELRPELRRHYGVSRTNQYDGPTWAGIGGFAPLGAPIVVDEAPRHPFFLDFGHASVDGWLTRVVASELRVEEDSVLDTVERQLVLDGDRIDLTKLEFEVFRYLLERPGKVVERTTMLRDIWGYDDSTGSNVIDALVTSLRRKLGPRASTIETVRGLGYRFIAPA